MRRRTFGTIIGASLMWFPALHAQPSARPLVAFLNGGSSMMFRDRTAGFLRGMEEAGFREGENTALEYAWAEGRYEQLVPMAAELVRRQPKVIMAAGGDVVALATKRATSTIPVVFVIGGDPVQMGLVGSLNRPDGNMTGVSLVSAALGAKRLELMRELLAGKSTIAVLVNPGSPTSEIDRRTVAEAASALGQTLEVVGASTEDELKAAFAQLARKPNAGVIVSTDAAFNSQRSLIIGLAGRYRIPAVYYERVFTLDGGLMSYGTSIVDAYRQAGVYVARILKGTKPSELPVIQPTKFELVINLKSAQSLGLAIPPSVLNRADEIIE